MKLSVITGRIGTAIVLVTLVACLVASPFAERSPASMGFVLGALALSTIVAAGLVLRAQGWSSRSFGVVFSLVTSCAATVIALLGLNFAVLVDSDSENGWRLLVMFAFCSTVLLIVLAAYAGNRREPLDHALVATISGTIGILALLTAPMIASYNWWVGLWAGIVAVGLFMSALIVPLTMFVERRARPASMKERGPS